MGGVGRVAQLGDTTPIGNNVDRREEKIMKFLKIIVYAPVLSNLAG